MPRSRIALLLIAVVSLLAVPLRAVGAPAAGDPYPIDVILPLTGVGAFVGGLQQKQLTALEGVVNRDGGIQGHPVRFAFHDDQSTPAVSLQLAREAAYRKPAVVLGSSLIALCNAAAPVYLEKGPVNYCFSPSIKPPKGGYIFAAGVSGNDIVTTVLRYLQGRGYHRIAMLNTTDGSGQAGDADFGRNLATPAFKDMTLLTTEHFNPSDPSVSAQVSKIKSLSPQAVIVWATGTAFGTALHGLQDVGLDVPVATTSANALVKQMQAYASFATKDVYFEGLPYISGAIRTETTHPYLAFAAALKDASLPQDFIGGLCWDAAMIVVDSLRKLGTHTTAAQLHEYLESLHDYVGITGVYDFRDGSQQGLLHDSPVFMVRWDGEKQDFVQVSKAGGAPM
jgi:branched-chain amino acid transport system substrate-binding protein